MGNFFLQIILFIYNTIAFHNLGVAIIEIAVLTRVIFYPFIKQQTHYSKKMAELQPHINALKEKHKGNQQAFAQAQMELFKQHGVNPAAGCLPSIVQIVVLFGLLGALNNILKMDHINLDFWVWNMAKPDAVKIDGLPFLVPGILVVLAALTQFIQTKMMLPVAPKIRKEDKPAEKQEKSDFMSEFAEAQSSMIWMFPLMFLFLGTQWPSGLALYWTISSVLMIIQQYQIAGLGGLEQYIVQLRKYAKS
ncbi:YidC/Oxa1 family membrane protein insertase [Patescibacteria group bacterium]|nr:YidC/Oxa1 family membrane protein insertase [Patescibacteria group bacterium]